MGALNQIDTAIIIVVAISSAFGLWRGLVKELLSLLSWIAALLVARGYGEPLARLLVNMIESESIRIAICHGDYDRNPDQSLRGEIAYRHRAQIF